MCLKFSLPNVFSLKMLQKAQPPTKLYGMLEKVNYVSTGNLFKPSNRKDCDGSQTLAEMCSKWLGVEVTKSPELSDRVCKPCGRKIRNASELCSFIQQGRNTLDVVEVTTVKRQLPTAVSSPERSPAVKKILKVTELDVPSGRESTAKRSLFGKENVESDSASTVVVKWGQQSILCYQH